MRQFLEHLRVWDQVELVPFPEDAAIEVVIPSALPVIFQDISNTAGDAFEGRPDREPIRETIEKAEVCGSYALAAGMALLGAWQSEYLNRSRASQRIVLASTVSGLATPILRASL